MPFQRPTLTQLRQQAAADFTSNLAGADGLLRFSNLLVTSTVLAGMANQHFGYLDWIAMQAVPFTSTDEYLLAWAGLKNVNLLDPTFASGSFTATGTNGVTIPAGTTVVRGDSFAYTTNIDATVSGGSVTVVCTAVTSGEAGNCASGTILSISPGVTGINSTGSAANAFTGGADLETMDSLRSRMLEAFQNPPQGGAVQDYVNWSLQLNGVTRVWPLRNGQGLGTVVVYFMMDVVESAYNGFPQGSNGVATNETRDIAATGDQLALANYLYPLQPVTALVYAVAPAPAAQNFTIAGLTPNTTAMKSAVSAAIEDCFFRKGAPCSADGSTGGGRVYMADIQASITAIPDIVDFIITSPTTDIVTTTGQLPTLGTITWV